VGYGVGMQYRFRPKSIRSDYDKYLKTRHSGRNAAFWGPFLEYTIYNAESYMSYDNIVSSVPLLNNTARTESLAGGLIIGATIFETNSFYSDAYFGLGLERYSQTKSAPSFDYDPQTGTLVYIGRTNGYSYSDISLLVKFGLNIGLKRQ